MSRITVCFTLHCPTKEIGYLEVHEGQRDWTVTSLWVHSDHRGLGWGTLIMNCMMVYIQQWEQRMNRRYKRWVRWTDASDRCFQDDHNIYRRLGAVYVKKKDPEMKWSIHDRSVHVGHPATMDAHLIIRVIPHVTPCSHDRMNGQTASSSSSSSSSSAATVDVHAWAAALLPASNKLC